MARIEIRHHVIHLNAGCCTVLYQYITRIRNLCGFAAGYCHISRTGQFGYEIVFQAYLAPGLVARHDMFYLDHDSLADVSGSQRVGNFHTRILILQLHLVVTTQRVGILQALVGLPFQYAARINCRHAGGVHRNTHNIVLGQRLRDFPAVGQRRGVIRTTRVARRPRIRTGRIRTVVTQVGQCNLSPREVINHRHILEIHRPGGHHGLHLRTGRSTRSSRVQFKTQAHAHLLVGPQQSAGAVEQTGDGRAVVAAVQRRILAGRTAQQLRSTTRSQSHKHGSERCRAAQIKRCLQGVHRNLSGILDAQIHDHIELSADSAARFGHSPDRQRRSEHRIRDEAHVERQILPVVGEGVVLSVVVALSVFARYRKRINHIGYRQRHGRRCIAVVVVVRRRQIGYRQNLPERLYPGNRIGNRGGVFHRCDPVRARYQTEEPVTAVGGRGRLVQAVIGVTENLVFTGPAQLHRNAGKHHLCGILIALDIAVHPRVVTRQQQRLPVIFHLTVNNQSGRSDIRRCVQAQAHVCLPARECGRGQHIKAVAARGGTCRDSRSGRVGSHPVDGCERNFLVGVKSVVAVVVHPRTQVSRCVGHCSRGADFHTGLIARYQRSEEAQGILVIATCGRTHCVGAGRVIVTAGGYHAGFRIRCAVAFAVNTRAEVETRDNRCVCAVGQQGAVRIRVITQVEGYVTHIMRLVVVAVGENSHLTRHVAHT